MQRSADRDRLWSLSDALMVVMGFDAVVVAVNPAWTQTLGWRAHETLSRDFVFDGDAAILDAEILMLRSVSQRRRMCVRFVCRHGGVVRDETEEIERGRQLREAQEQLRQTQKMEAIGQLTGGIVHDFNNMLQGIVLPLQLMQRRLQQGCTQVHGYIDAALESARRAAALTQRLLAFSRRQPLEVRATDVAAMLAGLQPMLLSSCGENIALAISLAEHLWSARTDLHQLESAVPSEPALAHQPATVLVVEDDNIVRALVVEILAEMGLRATQAASGTEAVALLSRLRFDLIISDIGLPGPDGLQLAELARERSPGTPVLPMTGYADSGDPEAEQLPAAAELLAKPFSAAAFVQKVQQILGPGPASG